MRRTKTSLLPSIDILESRVVLSSAAPLVSKHALSEIVRDVKAIVSTLAKTDNMARASAQLTALSSRIPSGPEALAPSWQGDLGLYRPHSPRSIVVTERQILGDLYGLIRDGVGGGSTPVTGSGSTTAGEGTASTTSSTAGQGAAGTIPPVSTPSLDSVTIQNTTGLALTVTIRLDTPQLQQPWITETIPAQDDSSVIFNFGTATDDFMTMDVSTANGSQSPTPLTNSSLSQPVGGYNGALYTISLLGPYFNVSVP